MTFAATRRSLGSKYTNKAFAGQQSGANEFLSCLMADKRNLKIEANMVISECMEDFTMMNIRGEFY